MITEITQDIRYAFRGLRRTPGFTTIAILSLTLGIGANTTLFTLINAIILRSLPVNHPEELFHVTVGTDQYLSNPVWEQLRDQQDVFSGIFAYGRWLYNMAPSGEVRPVQTQFVSGQFFDTLGVQPASGRTLTMGDDARGCAGAAVLSYRFWQREYAGNNDIIGKTISLDNHPLEIVGVSQPGFTGVEVGLSPDVFVPLCAEKALDGDGNILNNARSAWLQVMGRAKPGASSAQIKARLEALSPEVLRLTVPDLLPQDWSNYLARRLDAQPAANGLSLVRRRYQQSLMILMTIAGIVLLVACANLTNLLLARGAAREREFATRIALGSGRGRLIRPLLTESLLLSGAGAGLGILLAYGAARTLVSFLDASLDLAPDLRILAFAAAIAILSALLVGVAPAVRCTRLQPQQIMKATPRGVVGGSGFRLGKALVVLQVALSLALVVGAALLLRSLWKLNSIDAGLQPDPVLLVGASVPGNYTPEQKAIKFRQMLEKVRAIPGVHSASNSNIVPLCNCPGRMPIAVDNYIPRSSDSAVFFNRVSDQYFAALGIRLMEGRDFSSDDTPVSTKVAIVNESLARRYFRGIDPLGRSLRITEGSKIGAAYEIIGVVKDAKYGAVRDEMAPTLYLARNQDATALTSIYLEVRAAGDKPDALIAPLKSAVDRDVSLQFTPLMERVTKSLSRERLLAALAGIFGNVALVLAMMGLYGVMSYNTARRKNEIAIRMALGSSRGRLFRDVMREVMVLIGAGLALGLVLAITTTRFLAAFLYELKPNDPGTLMLAAVLLVVVGLLAGYLPARRASKSDIMMALRDE